MSDSINKKPTVVVVDDEEAVVAGLKTLLSGEFDIVGFADPSAAEQFLASSVVDAVISDYRMPGMNGLDLLKGLKATCPEASRMLMASRDEESTIIDGINEVGLFQYLEKPLDNEQVLLATRSAVERSTLIRSLREKIEQFDSAHSTLKNIQRRLIDAFL